MWRGGVSRGKRGTSVILTTLKITIFKKETPLRIRKIYLKLSPCSHLAEKWLSVSFTNQEAKNWFYLARHSSYLFSEKIYTA